MKHICWRNIWNALVGRLYVRPHYHPEEYVPPPPLICDHCGTQYHPYSTFFMNVLDPVRPNYVAFADDAPIQPIEVPIKRWCLRCMLEDPKMLGKLKDAVGAA